MPVSKAPNRIAIPIASSGTDFYIYMRRHVGVITRYLLEIPSLTNAPTVTLQLIDENSKTIWSGAAHVSVNGSEADFSVPIDIEIDGTYKANLHLSGVAGATGTAYLTCWIRK